MISKYLLIFLISFPFLLIAQIKNETRAVWIAANYRLDWPPPTFNAKQQKDEFKKILNNIQSKNLNTIYLQVYFNGTALYKSRTEPMSYFITGVMDDSLAYDPLKYAIEECHSRGIEIHAWINTIQCFNGMESFIKDHPKHIIKRHPEWVREKFLDGRNTYWLDPGLPEVQKFIINLSAEIMSNYDIDGLQLDFLRYPSADFNDTESYKLYAYGQSRDDWRRENLTKIVAGIRKKIDSMNKKIRFGITPIGIYKNISGARGLQGYTDVYQDTFDWLKKKLIDYAAPQVYWNFEDNPKFDVVAENWIKNSNGRNIILGIAAYRNDVFREIDKMISYARNINAAGVAFFRYSNIKDAEFKLFADKVFPAKTEWIDNESPEEIDKINLLVENDSSINIYWNSNSVFEKENDISGYLIFKLADESDKPSMKNLFHFVPAGKNQSEFVIKNPSRYSYFFTLKTIDRFWNMSLSQSNIVKAEIPALTNYQNRFSTSSNPILIKKDENKFVISIYSLKDDNLILSINAQEISDSIKLEPGLNLIEKEYDLNKIKSLKIRCVNIDKEYLLKFKEAN